MKIERRVRLALNQVQWYVEERLIESKNGQPTNWQIEKVFYSEQQAEKYMKARR